MRQRESTQIKSGTFLNSLINCAFQFCHVHPRQRGNVDTLSQRRNKEDIFDTCIFRGKCPTTVCSHPFSKLRLRIYSWHLGTCKLLSSSPFPDLLVDMVSSNATWMAKLVLHDNMDAQVHKQLINGFNFCARSKSAKNRFA